ncbi:MAG: hypothetical protein M1840_008525 [Geoglossum simile]|nr:MAG: hypothetical protein M1840_008525 [Geoglossum simile]
MDAYTQEDIDLEDLLHGDGPIPILDGHRPKMPDRVREAVFRVPHRARIPVVTFPASKSKSSNSQSSCPLLSFSSSKGSVPGDQANFLQPPTDGDPVPRYNPKTTHATDNRTSPVILPYESMPPSDTAFGTGQFFGTMFESGPLFDTPPDPVPFLSAEFRPRSQTPQASASPDKPDSDGAEAADQSADDEANSLHSSDGTEREDSLLGCTGYAGSCCEQSVDGEEIIRPILDPVKRALIDRVMVEFRALFEANWTSNATQQAASGSRPHNSSHAQTSGNSSKSSLPTNKNGKHRMADRDIGEPDDDDENNHPKRRKANSTPPDTTNDGLKLACPFHKRDPRKYSTNNVTGIKYRACSGPGWVKIGRIKEHLYRRHRAPTQCKRCWSTFDNELELQNHVRDANGCELRPEQPIEGITRKIGEELRSKKKLNSGLDEEGKWKSIYEILFPGEPIPTPYYEPAEFTHPGSPASRAISDYEEFSKRKLPQLVRRRLEAAAEDESQHIEEKLKTLLVGIVQECQGSVLLLYQEQRQTVATGSMEATDANPTDSTPSPPAPKRNTATHPGELQTDIMNDTLIPLFHQNTLQANISACCPEIIPNAPTDPQVRRQPSSSESGYGSLQSACKCPSFCHCGATESPDETGPGSTGDVPLPPEAPAGDPDDFALLFADWVDP